MLKVKSNNGSALMITIVIMAVLIILSAAFANVGLFEFKQGVRDERLAQAHYISISAAEAVADYLVVNQFDTVTVGPLIENIEGGVDKTFPNVDFPNSNFANGTYNILVSGQPGTIVIESTGAVDNKYNKENTLVISNMYPDPFLGLYALASKTIIEAAGMSFDIDGNIMSNGPQQLTASQLTNVSGSTDFDADVPFPIVEYPFSEFEDGINNVPATVIQINNGITSDFTFENNRLYNVGANASGKAIDINSSQITFNTGSSSDVTIVNLQGSFEQGGSSNITFNGSGLVMIYVDGSVNFFGGTWNQIGFAGNLVIYVPKDPPTDPSRNISISGNTDYSAHIIAPNVDMTYNGGGSNWFTGSATVNYFSGQGNFKVDQDTLPSSAEEPLTWPWTKVFWQK